jgi:regulator of nucleoside diphosphate kinase
VFARGDLEAEATLVYPWDADASSGSISVLSELGSAMIGCRVGTRITGLSAGGHPVEWSLVQLLYQPEVAGDMHL